MLYKTSDFKGKLQEGLRIRNITGQELYNSLKRDITRSIRSRGIPATITDNEVKDGGMFNSARYPMLVIHHPDPSCKYYDIGISVNNTLVDFPLLGESAEWKKSSSYDMHRTLGNSLRASFFRPDENKLYAELDWRHAIPECIEDCFD